MLLNRQTVQLHHLCSSSYTPVVSDTSCLPLFKMHPHSCNASPHLLLYCSTPYCCAVLTVLCCESTATAVLCCKLTALQPHIHFLTVLQHLCCAVLCCAVLSYRTPRAVLCSLLAVLQVSCAARFLCCKLPAVPLVHCAASYCVLQSHLWQQLLAQLLLAQLQTLHNPAHNHTAVTTPVVVFDVL